MKYLKIFDRSPNSESEFGTYIKLTRDSDKLKNGNFSTGEEKTYDQSSSVTHPSRSRHSWVQGEGGLMQVDRNEGRAGGQVHRGYSALGYARPGTREYRARHVGSGDIAYMEDLEDKDTEYNRTLEEEDEKSEVEKRRFDELVEEYFPGLNSTERRELYEAVESSDPEEGPEAFLKWWDSVGDERAMKVWDELHDELYPKTHLNKFPIMSLLGPGYVGTSRSGTSFYHDPSGASKYMSKLTKGNVKEGQEGGIYRELKEGIKKGDWQHNLFDPLAPDDAKIRASLKSELQNYYNVSDRDLHKMYTHQKGAPHKALVLMESDDPVTTEDIKSGLWDPQRDVYEEAQLKKAKALGEVPVWKYVRAMTPKGVEELRKGMEELKTADPALYYSMAGSRSLSTALANFKQEYQDRLVELQEQRDDGGISQDEYTLRRNSLPTEVVDSLTARFAEPGQKSEQTTVYDLLKRAAREADRSTREGEEATGDAFWDFDPRAVAQYAGYGPAGEADPEVLKGLLKQEYQEKTGDLALLNMDFPEDYREKLASAYVQALMGALAADPSLDVYRTRWSGAELQDLQKENDKRVGYGAPGHLVADYLNYLAAGGVDDLHFLQYFLDYDKLLDNEFNYNDPTVASDERVKFVERPRWMRTQKSLKDTLKTLRF